MGSRPFSGAVKRRKKKKTKRKKDTTEEMEEWRQYWREAGPIRFAEEVLTCPRSTPPHPDLGVVPEYIILSEDEKELLYDLWKEIVSKFIVTAGRGGGKTMDVAVYVVWRISCFDNFTMTTMGGILEQSEKIKEYIDDWRDDVKEIAYCLHRSTGGGNRTAVVHSRWRSYARFPPCSEAASKGPHVTQLIIDEAAAGEAKSRGGARAVRAARGQLISSPNLLFGLTSTADYVLGTFYDTWMNAEKMGYKKYRWSTVKHKSPMWYGADGKPNWTYIDDILSADLDPKNWEPNVWWVTQEQIDDWRPDTTKDEWIVQALGGISRGSGLVFSRDDLKDCICKGEKYSEDGSECEDCDSMAYTEECPLMKYMKLKLSMISDRRMGVDFGQVAPNAVTIVGRRGKFVFVLYSDEGTGMREEEVLEWVDEEAKKYVIWEIYCDPEERAMRSALENKEYSVPNIWTGAGGGRAKRTYVSNVKRHFEQGIIIIPDKFQYLIFSLSGLSYDDKGNIRKRGDHSFDSLCYSMADYSPDEHEKFYEGMRGTDIKIWKD